MDPDHDHRRLGRELELFGTDPLIGSGLPYWLPAGAAVRHELEEYVRRLERRAGYQHVHSPVLGRRELYELSGHWEHYRDGMFPPLAEGPEDGGGQLVLRPSLCPHHCLVYRSRGRSHRELPLRIAELGGMFREEPSGALGGLSRVRAIQLNDGHVFCPPELAGDEIGAVLDLVDRVYRDLGLTPHRYRLSLPGDGAKYVEDPQMWRSGEQVLAEVLRSRGIRFDAERGEAAFYGPKIDVQVLDAAGRESTLSTVQVDGHLPARFGLRYRGPERGPDGEDRRPLVIHRSVLGSLERLVAHLVEACGGAFAGWLAPVQLVVLPVGDAERVAAADLGRAACAAGLRVEVVDADRGTLAARVRQHRLVPFQAVLGRREAAADRVSLRLRSGERLDDVPVVEALARIAEAVRPPG
jgi:threonyl-tRNA synthetase